MKCLFVSDLHGNRSRYEKLSEIVRTAKPSALFIGGDLLAGGSLNIPSGPAFIREYVVPLFSDLRQDLGAQYPCVFVILGNDDPRTCEEEMRRAEAENLWTYAHNRAVELDGYTVFGYACVPPTPFRLKDWERYDVSRYVDPGCVSPEEGYRTVDTAPNEIKYRTIATDLDTLTGNRDLSQAICLFHTPPHQTKLDRAALDGKTVDYVPVDVHVGSIAVRQLFEKHQPLVGLHGHIHESVRLTGDWQDAIGRTVLFGASHDGPELAVIEFGPDDPAAARRHLL